MIVFQNEGLLDMKAVTMFGVSVKKTNSPIGFFGTGLKYAIAVLLRTKCEIDIYVAHDCYSFRRKPGNFRGEAFEFVVMTTPQGHEVDLGFTTELGKTWELWQAYRELWCNAVDEGGVVNKFDNDSIVLTEDKTTRVVVKGAAFEQVHDGRSDFLLQNDPSYRSLQCDAHPGSGDFMFYKGIAVKKHLNRALFDYNLKGDVELTEDRTLKYDFRGNYAVISLILSSEDEAFIEYVVTAPKDTMEGNLNYTLPAMNPGPTWMRVVGKIREREMDSIESLNASAFVLHREHSFRSILPQHSVKLSKVQKMQFERAKTFVGEVLDCDMDKYPIIFLDTLGPGHLGRASNGRIYISKAAFENGTKWVAMALYEEYVHLHDGVKDETLAQKLIYLEKIMTLGEQLRGEPL